METSNPNADKFTQLYISEIDKHINNRDYSHWDENYVRLCLKQIACQNLNEILTDNIIKQQDKKIEQLVAQLIEFQFADFSLLRRFFEVQAFLNSGHPQDITLNVNDDVIHVISEESERRGKPGIIKRFSNYLEITPIVIKDIFGHNRDSAYKQIHEFAYIWTTYNGKRSGNTFTIFLSEQMQPE